LLLVFVQKIKVKTSLLDILPQDWKTVQELHKIQKKFGGLGQLTLIIEGQDSIKNKEVLYNLVDLLGGDKSISFLDYQREIAFFEKHKLLFAPEKILQEVSSRLQSHLWSAQKRTNPLLVDLLDRQEKNSLTQEIASLQKLEAAYTSSMKTLLGSPDQKILVLRIFPAFESTDFRKCAQLIRKVESLTQNLPRGVNTHLTGGILKRVQEEGRLTQEIRQITSYSLLAMVFLLLIFFYRIPTGVFALVLAMTMGVIWTLGLGYFIYGQLSLITLSLALVIVGLGLSAGIHILSRYLEEKQKGLSSGLAFETVLLETGPAITTSSLTAAAVFFAIGLVDFDAFAEFGWLTSIGLICTTLAILLVYPALLQTFEKHRLLPILGLRVKQPPKNSVQHYRAWPIHLLILATFIGFSLGLGPQKRFETNLSKLDFPNPNKTADSLLKVSGEAISSPAIFLAPNQKIANLIADSLRQRKKNDTVSPSIHSILTLSDILPKNQSEKLTQIRSIQSLITPRIIERSPPQYQSILQDLYKSSKISDTLTLSDLPKSFKRIFWGKVGSAGAFTFAFPSNSLDSGHNAQAFAEDTREVVLPSQQKFISSGLAVLFADLLHILIPQTSQALLLALLMVIVLIFIDLKSCRTTGLLIIPPLLSLYSSLCIFQFFSIELSFYNLIILPVIIGLGVDYSVYIYHRYAENGSGSLSSTLPRTFKTSGLCLLVTATGFAALTFSSHQGLKTLGYSAFLGQICAFIISYLWTPALLGFLEKGKCHNAT